MFFLKVKDMSLLSNLKGYKTAGGKTANTDKLWGLRDCTHSSPGCTYLDYKQQDMYKS